VLDLVTIIQQCAPAAAPATIEAVIRAESGFNPLALHVNGNVRLEYQPATAQIATAWSEWLIKRGYSVDMGLMQINSSNLASLNITPAGAFAACQNIRAGAELLTRNYVRATQSLGSGTPALLRAISAYNTGNFRDGFANGYVARVLMGHSVVQSPAVIDLTSLLRGRAVNLHKPVPPALADTQVRGFLPERGAR
jgi:type IV secretion system protein VirB1